MFASRVESLTFSKVVTYRRAVSADVGIAEAVKFLGRAAAEALRHGEHFRLLKPPEGDGTTPFFRGIQTKIATPEAGFEPASRP